MGRQLSKKVSIFLILALFGYSIGCTRGAQSPTQVNEDNASAGTPSGGYFPGEPTFDFPTQWGLPGSPTDPNGYFQASDLDTIIPPTNSAVRSDFRAQCFNDISDGNLYDDTTFYGSHTGDASVPARNSHRCFDTTHLNQNADLEIMMLKLAAYSLDQMYYCFRLVLNRGPQVGSSTEASTYSFQEGRLALLRCYWTLKNRMVASVPMRPEIQQHEDSNSNLFYYLLLGGLGR